MKNQQKTKALLNVQMWWMWSNGQKCECLCCDQFEAVEYVGLVGMRYGEVNAVTQRV